MIQNDADSEFQSFENKRKQLFDCLQQAENGLKGTNLDQTKKGKTNFLNKPRQIRASITKFRGKESIFKKPELPLIKCLKPRVTPDYQVNPHKWKKYSLSDVDISDRTNTAAAFSFLKDIEIHKDGNSENDMEDDDDKVKLVFNKSVRAKRDLGIKDEDDEDKPKLKGAKLMMPEYIVGQKSTKEKRKQRGSKNEDSGKQLQLSHLLEEEDD